jgi:hypothetical protein
MTISPSPITCWRAAEEAYSFRVHRARFEAALMKLGRDASRNEVAMALYHSVGWLLALDNVANLLPEIGPGPFEIDREPEPARLMRTLATDELEQRLADLRALAGRVDSAFGEVEDALLDLDERGALPAGSLCAFRLSSCARAAGASAQWDPEVEELGRALGVPDAFAIDFRKAIEESDADLIRVWIDTYDAWASASLD